MSRKIDLIGLHIGKLIVLEFSHKTNKEYFKCSCVCGTETLQSRTELVAELRNPDSVRSCGCSRTAANIRKALDITGEKFGKLTAEFLNKVEGKWLCSCDCGNQVFVKVASLRNGNTTSCGCKRAETTGQQLYEKHASRRAERGIDEVDFSRTENDVQRQEFNKFSRRILERDNFTCLWCSQVGGELNAHHLDFWADYPEKRFDMDNLITLCRPCHLKLHQNNFHGPAEPVMDILLRGYSKVLGLNENWCVRIELTPN